MFQSTLPTRGSDAERHEYGRDAVRFQSTLPTRGSDAWCACPCRPDTTVSIHAPHEGERRYAGQYRPVGQGFNPRSPRGGATPFLCTVRIAAARFQSTLPTRGSDKTRRDDSGRGAKFQSTLPTRGSDKTGDLFTKCLDDGFNPRSPRGGATPKLRKRKKPQTFQSTLPTRGSDPYKLFVSRRARAVSIHAPHEGERPRLVARVAPA